VQIIGPSVSGRIASTPKKKDHANEHKFFHHSSFNYEARFCQ
jgi:hypothetical protein